MKSIVSMLLGCALLASVGCSGPKPILERGWIGGEFEERGVWVPGESDEEDCREGVLVTDVYPDTPIAAAGVVEGDVILAVGDHSVDDRDDLMEQIQAAQPGDALALQIYRIRDESGEQEGTLGPEVTPIVVAGTERYKRMGNISLGLGFGTHLDFVPPEINILGLLRFSCNDRHPQFQSPQARLRRALSSDDPELRGGGWSFWLLIIGAGKHDAIIAQEAFPKGVQPQ